jgi:cytochrome P450
MSLPDPVDYPFAWEPPMEVPAGWRTLREHSLQPVRLPSGDPAVLVTRYRDVKALFSDHRLSRNTGRYPTSRISPNNEIFNDPERLLKILDGYWKAGKLPQTISRRPRGH